MHVFLKMFSPARARNEFVLIYSASERLNNNRKKMFFLLFAPAGQNILFFKKTICTLFQRNLKTEFWKTSTKQLSVNLIQNVGWLV